MKLMLLMSENGRIRGRGPICRRLVYNGSVRTTCKKRGRFVLRLKTAQKSAGIYSRTLPESRQRPQYRNYVPIAVLRMDVVKDFFRIRAFVFRPEVGSIGIHKFQSRLLVFYPVTLNLSPADAAGTS